MGIILRHQCPFCDNKVGFFTGGYTRDGIPICSECNKKGREMSHSTPNVQIIGFGVAGFFVGGLIGFLFRPSAPLVGQLSFDQVISRGANLSGIDQLLIPLAQRSFNIIFGVALVGAIIGALIGYYISTKK
jgi:hypothetical protein